MEYIGKPEREKFRYKVVHPQHGEARVIAEDRLHAVVEAAHSWGINKWTSIARACEVEKLGTAPKKPAAKRTRAKKGENHGD